MKKGLVALAALLLTVTSFAQQKIKTEVFYKDKEVCITGKISLYKEKPQIVVCNEKQLVVK